MYCPVCEEPIESDWAAHEWLVKRSAVPKSKQHLILVPENTVFLHNQQCHLPKGQSRETARLCLFHVARALTAWAIGEWYISLWKEHGLSVPRGAPVPLEALPLHLGRRFYDLAGEIQPAPRGEAPAGYDIRDIAFAVTTKRRYIYSRGKKVDLTALDLQEHIAHLHEGYWLDYLLGVI